MWYFKINLEVPRGEGLRNGKKIGQMKEIVMWKF